MPEGYVFLNGHDTRTLQDAMGNVPDGTEVGLVAPASDDENWFVVFDYNEVGDVKDDEKDKYRRQRHPEGHQGGHRGGQQGSRARHACCRCCGG